MDQETISNILLVAETIGTELLGSATTTFAESVMETLAPITELAANIAETMAAQASETIANFAATEAAEVIAGQADNIPEVIIKGSEDIIAAQASFLLMMFRMVMEYVPWFMYHLLSTIFSYVQHGTIYTVTATITLDFYSILWLTFLFSFITYMILRYRYWNKYSRLENPTTSNREGFNLQPDVGDEFPPNYPDEFMNAFLSSIKVFGYLDKPVFHELARHLQTKRLNPGQILFDPSTPTSDFYVVVDGTMQIFVKNPGADEEAEENETDELAGHHLLHEVQSGGTVSSLFTILDLFTRDFEMPSPLTELCRNEDDHSAKAGKDKDAYPFKLTKSTIEETSAYVKEKETQLPFDENKSANIIPDALKVSSPENETPQIQSVSQQSVFPKLWGTPTTPSIKVDTNFDNNDVISQDSSPIYNSTSTREVSLPSNNSISAQPNLVARAKTATSLAVYTYTNDRSSQRPLSES